MPAKLAAQEASRPDEPALRSVTRALCRKRVALLGESPSHGAGHTIAFKAELVRRLVERCGFYRIVFESSRYEFIGLERGIRAKIAKPEDLSAAIGGLWRFDREMDGISSFLFAEAQRGRVRLFGLDAQIGGLAEPFANTVMIPELARPLPPARADQCVSAFARHVEWSYPTDKPYGQAEHDLLLSCLQDMRGAPARASARGGTQDERRIMIENLIRNISADLGSPMEKTAARESILFDNFKAITSQFGSADKVIVWGATVHLAKDASGIENWLGRNTFGARVRRLYGPEAFSLGFTARTGSVRRFRNTADVEQCQATSLEAASPVSGTSFLTGKRLRSLGRVEGHALDDQCRLLNWADVLDGVVVFDEEWPARNRRYEKPA